MGIRKETFGHTKDGKEVFLYTLENAKKSVIKITNWGGIVTHLLVPDKSGKLDDIVLGFDSLEPYLSRHPYFGAIIGRYGNRIGKAQFTLNGKRFALSANEGKNQLHGGFTGFDMVAWEAAELPSGDGLELTYLSKDGEEGFPGNLRCTVKYVFNDKDEFSIEYAATTDKPTVVNLTQHSYFNLEGAGNGDILNHSVTIKADKFTVVDAEQIPTGELKSVKGTVMDFNQPRVIASGIGEAGGYDHNYVLSETSPRPLSLAAAVTEPGSGRKMEVLTTEPGIQFYTGNNLDGSVKGKGGKTYPKHGGLCLETQHFPDSPNQPAFPTTVLNPGDRYHTQTVYRFSA
ncbi:MAG: galactose mutarotase [Anaerolineales bacterium]|nr:galactose mutarotase [Anaerolineales bacterium]